MKRLTALALAGLVCGCSGLNSGQAHRYYVLDPVAAPAAPAAGTKHDLVLLVAPVAVDSFYDTQDIVYSMSPGARSYYQFSSWTEPPGRRVEALLAARIDGRGTFRAVALAGEGVRGNLLLAARLEEIYHDATGNPGSARVTLSAELIDTGRRSLVGRRKFSASVPVPSHDAAGAVIGCRQALGLVLDQVVAWIDEAAPDRAPP